MPIGIIVNVLAVALGGLLGTAVGEKLPNRIKDLLNLTFGCCALTMGITSVILMQHMPAVILSVIVGALIGSWLQLSDRIRTGATKLIEKVLKNEKKSGTSHSSSSEEVSSSIVSTQDAAQPKDNSLLVTAIVLFCVSGTGIYGSLVSGMEGDHSILLSKAILDLFTAMIFACELKQATSLIAIPQLIIMLLLFFGARLILPLTDAGMIADFKACGGILLLATGLTIMKVKVFPLADLIPAMILVMPISYLWTRFIAPLL